MIVLIFGNGWLANNYYDYLNGLGRRVVISGENILDSIEVRKEILIYGPELVINCAGKCGSPNIDWCELTEENRQLTEQVNAFGPRVLFDAVRRETAAPFVHLSSGCLWDVDDDNEPLTEEETPDPPSFYSETKMMGEYGLQGQDAIIIRLRMPLDSVPHPRNLIDKLRGYKYVLDVPNSVTTVETLMRATMHLVKKRCTGVYNVVDGTTTGAELMGLYQNHVDPNHEFTPITKAELYDLGLAKSKRSNCRLSSEKLNATGFPRVWDTGIILSSLMGEYAKATKASA